MPKLTTARILTKDHAQFVRWLRARGACNDGINWVKDHKTDARSTFDTLERADWLLWLIERLPGVATPQQLTLAACACAETVLCYVPNGEERPRRAIETARAWTRGEATAEEVNAARAAARAAAWAADGAAAWAAAMAAARAAWAAAWAADGAAGRRAGRRAAWAAAWAAANKRMCVLVREIITLPKEG